MVSFSKSFALSLLLVAQRTVQAQPVQEPNNKLLLTSITSTFHIPNDNLFKRLDSSEGGGDLVAPLDNQVVQVVTTVRAGNNQEFKDIFLDTSSAILWVGGEELEPYEVGPNTEDINATFSVSYGLGFVSGKAYKDTVTIGEATAMSQIIGAAESITWATQFKPFGGILGLGPSHSNGGQISGFNTTPTFVETLVSQGSIDQPVFAIYVAPVVDTNEDGQAESVGEISFGGPNPARFTGEMEWLDQPPPFNFRWQFNSSGMSFGNLTYDGIINGRIDIGGIGLRIPTDQLIRIITTYDADIIDSGPLAGLLSLPAPPPEELYTTYPPLNFILGSQEFSIDSQQYLIPKSLYAQFNLTDTIEVPVDPQNPQGNQTEKKVAHTWITSAGIGAVNFGEQFLASVYTAFDMANHRVGFAHPKKLN